MFITQTLSFSVTYEFQHRTSARGKWDGGAFSGYFYTVIGTLGETAEHDCEADRELGGTDSCVIKDFTDIGDIKGLRIRNSGDNTWRFVKIAVTIDGVYGGTYEGYTSVDDYATVTVHIMSDPGTFLEVKCAATIENLCLFSRRLLFSNNGHIRRFDVR